MYIREDKHIGIIIVLGLLSMLMPLAIDMYLPALPIISKEFNINNGSVQMTLTAYILGFTIGQLFYGPLADSIGRKPVILFGTLCFGFTSLACALSTSIDMLIYMRFLHGLSAAATSVVIHALMRDLFNKDDFSRMMSFVVLVMTMAPLFGPIVGGSLLLKFSWNIIFFIISLAAFIITILVIIFIKETLPKEKRKKLYFGKTLNNFKVLLQHKKILGYMLSSGFSFAGMFSFLSAGSFVYIEVNGVSIQNFGYYFALNIIFLFIITFINSSYVARLGTLKMFFIGLIIQVISGLGLIIILLFHLNFNFLVFGIAIFVGCIAMIMSNSISVILEEFPHMIGTTSSLAGTIRFGISTIVGILLSKVSSNSAWPMILFMNFCSIFSLLFYLYSFKHKKYSFSKKNV